MKLTYFGHSTFLLEAEGTSILIDPFNEQVGYPFPDVLPQAIAISHEHFDHTYVQMAKGSPKIIRALRNGGNDWADVRERIGPLSLTAVPTYHDTSQGSDRGKNAMLIFEGEGLRLVHSGDLGHTLSSDQVKALGRVDALLLPVGGHYTIGPTEAGVVVDQLHPRVVIPMHYKTEVNQDWPITSVDLFTAGKARVAQRGHSVMLSAAALPVETEIWVLRHSG